MQMHHNSSSVASLCVTMARRKSELRIRMSRDPQERNPENYVT